MTAIKQMKHKDLRRNLKEKDNIKENTLTLIRIKKHKDLRKNLKQKDNIKENILTLIKIKRDNACNSNSCVSIISYYLTGPPFNAYKAHLNPN